MIQAEQKSIHDVFIAGGTGYIGQRLIPCLLQRGHRVVALSRSGSESKLPAGCISVPGNALQIGSYDHSIAPADTFIHMVGVSHPSPSKADQFREVDLKAAEVAIAAAVRAKVQHFIYISVAHPAPIMAAYIEVRIQCEELIKSSKLNATILRPWYVLGPGHRWPYALVPLYGIAKLIAKWREGALRLGLVSLRQMTAALVACVENPPNGIRVLEVPEIRDRKTTAIAKESGVLPSEGS